MPANRHDKLVAADKLRWLLKALGVPAEIPSRYASLATFARENDQRDSCGALVEFRNGLVHPNGKRGNIVLRAADQASFEAWQLSLWYPELALLYLLDHQGGTATGRLPIGWAKWNKCRGIVKLARLRKNRVPRDPTPSLGTRHGGPAIRDTRGRHAPREGAAAPA